MKIKIYQIDPYRDDNDLKFMDLAYTKKHRGPEFPDSSIYNKVYEGDVRYIDLEQIYHLFNTDPPEGYKGHSLSVSDVVEVEEAQGDTPGFYYCDHIGFERIELDPTLTKDATGLIRVVMPLRYNYAVLALQNGDDVKTVQNNMGHATAAFTLDVYGHVSEKMKDASADRMQRYIENL